MTSLPRMPRMPDAATTLLGSAPFGRALVICIVATAYLSFTVKSTMGWAGLIAIVATLVVLAAVSIAVRPRDLEWRGLLPISLLAFVGWSAISVFWSDYQWASLGSIAYQIAFAFLAVYVALTRDLIQVVRGFGDVLRVLLSGGLVLEILSGLLLDIPISFLHITGNLGQAGPIQGLFGSRNQLGLVALIALATFFVEWRTRSVHRPVAFGSLALAAVMVLLTRSPVTFVALAVLAIAAIALRVLRRSTPESRRIGQFVLLGSVLLISAVAVAGRVRIVGFLNARTELETRLSLWRGIRRVVPDNSLEGFGWIGYWQPDLPPYIGINPFSGPHQSALSAFVDVSLQLGLVGLVTFIAFVGLAFVRSWLLASNKTSVVYLWPALTLAVLLSVSGVESSALVEFGWLTLVICGLKASQNLSWRTRLPSEPLPEE